MLFLDENNIITALHYYSIALAFVFGAFISEWISGRLLIKEPKGTKGIWDETKYLSKSTAVNIRILEVLVMAIISIPLSSLLLYIFDISSFYVVVISIAVFNTIYFFTLLELPYKIKVEEIVIIWLIYLVCVIATTMTWYSLK